MARKMTKTEVTTTAPSTENTNKIKRKCNTYDLSGEYGIGYTLKGEKFYFDLEDYDKIKNYYWYTNNYGYLVSHISNSTKMAIQHSIIMNAEGAIVDHINHDKLDNRKNNLRLCTISQNAMNMLKPSDNTSGCKGVGLHKASGNWRAFITVNQKQISLGYFNNYEDAVKARKEAEEKYFGEFKCMEVGA